MENTKHTPGPWRAVEKSPLVIDDVTVSIHTIETKFGAIARVIGSKANARLISLAPEMLEALRQSNEYIREHGNKPNFVKHIDSLLSRINK